MGDVQAVAKLDRLPWLTDDTPDRARRGGRRRGWSLWLVAVLALLALGAIAAAAYWLGARSKDDIPAPPVVAVPNRSPVTVPLPEPSDVTPVPQPEVALTPQPEVEPVVERPLPAPRTTSVPQPRVTPRAAAPRSKLIAAPPRRSVKPAPATRAKPATLPIWPVRAEQNSSGRLVRVGTFASVSDAKRGWSKVMRFYPGMKRLPALVVPIQAVPSGRRYYRLQMGTTSQAHSEVLCQRMRIIGVSCVVLDIGPTVRQAP